MPSRSTAKATSTWAKTSTAGASSASFTREWARLPGAPFLLRNRNCNLSGSLRFEQIQIDGFSHLKIAERRWMNSIAAIVSDVQEVRIRGAAHDAIEIDDGIKG